MFFFKETPNNYLNIEIYSDRIRFGVWNIKNKRNFEIRFEVYIFDPNEFGFYINTVEAYEIALFVWKYVFIIHYHDFKSFLKKMDNLKHTSEMYKSPSASLFISELIGKK